MPVGLKDAETRRWQRPGEVGAEVLRLSMIEGRLRSVPALLTPAMLAARSIPVLRLCVKLRRTKKLQVGVFAGFRLRTSERRV